MKRSILLSMFLTSLLWFEAPAVAGDGSAIGEKRPPVQRDGRNGGRDRFEISDIFDIFRRG